MIIINLMSVWEQAKDLNFGEAVEVIRCAELAAEQAIRDIRKAKIKAACKRQDDEYDNIAIG